MSEHMFEIGDIVIGLCKANENKRGEVISITELKYPFRDMCVVRYEDGRELGHFRNGSHEIKWIGKKIPVINIEDLI